MTQQPQLCPVCKTGKETYALDPKEVLCPNICRHKNGECGAFAPLGQTHDNHTVFSSNGLNINKNF